MKSPLPQKPPKTRKKPFNVKVDPHQLEAFRHVAKQSGRTASEAIRDLIALAIESYERDHKGPKAGT